MKAFGAALVLSLSLLGAEHALAADMPLPGGAPIPPSSYYPVSPPVNWGGLYIGMNGGYGLGSTVWKDTVGSTGSFAANGGIAGATLGINYAGFGDWVLLGIEGDFDWSGATGSSPCFALGLGANATCTTRIDWLSTFRLRAGYTWSHFLFYGTAGGATGDYRLSSANPTSTHNPTPPLGWAAGAGIEYLFNDAISAKFEYLYVDLLNVGCPSLTLCNFDSTNGSVSFKESLIRAGVNYKFSW
jgi:outer membrane immunogenic protein